MGFNIKYNFANPIDNHDGGIIITSTEDALTLYEKIMKMMGKEDGEDIEDADFEDITPEQIQKISEVVKGTSTEQEDQNKDVELPQEIENAPANTLTQNSDFIKNKLKNAVMLYYQGSPTKLAYIAAVADDWGILRARNRCLDFVYTCIAIGAIKYVSPEDVKRIHDGMKKKLMGQSRGEKGARYSTDPLPCDYKMWTDESLKKNIAFCDLIAKEFEGPGMFNRFEKRREQEASR